MISVDPPSCKVTLVDFGYLGFPAPKDLNYLAFQSFDCERT
jgi:hypothetical protein